MPILEFFGLWMFIYIQKEGEIIKSRDEDEYHFRIFQTILLRLCI